MDKVSYILAVLAANDRKTYSPVQLQKLFFILDREASGLLGGPHFEFQPYDYGPFDRNVYKTLENLEEQGLAHCEQSGNSRYRTYSLTSAGYKQGKAVLGSLAPDIQAYVGRVGEFVSSLNFADLVSAIYKEYPDMKINSVFNG